MVSDVFNMLMYADDTTLSCNINQNISEIEINHELWKVSQWLAANKLSLNVGKTKFMVFRIRYEVVSYPDLQINGNTIDRHEIFPEFSGIPEFSRPQRSFLWKSQIRFNIYGGGGGTIYSVCSPSVSNVGTAHHKSSQASCVYTMSIFTSRPIYYNSLIFCIVCVCTSLLIFKLSYVTLKQ